MLTSKVAPGPQGFSVFRNVLGFYSTPLDMFAELVDQYGPVARVELGPYCFHLLTRPEYVRHVLIDNAANYRKSVAYGQTRAVAGLGLATNSEVAWRRRRHLVQAAFASAHIPACSAIVTERTQALLERWRALAGANLAVNVWLELLDLHYEILGQILFGVNLANASQLVREALDTVRDITTRRINALVALPDGLPTPEKRHFQRAVTVLNEFTFGLIRDRRREGPTGSDVLSQLCHPKNGTPLNGNSSEAALTDEELRDEMMSLFFSGYEDSANALTWTLYLLAQHPAEMTRLRAEMAEVAPGEQLTFEHLEHLHFLKGTVAESLRLYPPSWGILRDAATEDEIDGYRILAGSTVFIPTYLIHRLPEIWPDADRFDPAQFSNGHHLTEAQTCAYHPFGAGERACIAQDFALVELQLITGLLVQHYNFQLLPGYPVEPLALQSLRPRNGLLMVVQSV